MKYLLRLYVTRVSCLMSLHNLSVSIKKILSKKIIKENTFYDSTWFSAWRQWFIWNIVRCDELHLSCNFITLKTCNLPTLRMDLLPSEFQARGCKGSAVKSKAPHRASSASIVYENYFPFTSESAIQIHEKTFSRLAVVTWSVMDDRVGWKNHEITSTWSTTDEILYWLSFKWQKHNLSSVLVVDSLFYDKRYKNAMIYLRIENAAEKKERFFGCVEFKCLFDKWHRAGGENSISVSRYQQVFLSSH